MFFDVASGRSFGKFSFHNFEFASGKQFVQKKPHRLLLRQRVNGARRIRIPTGFRPKAQGLRGTRVIVRKHHQPQRRLRPYSHGHLAQPRWGRKLFLRFTQGSSFVATLG